jgi:hypothetical protein
MSPIGPKRTFVFALRMSALGGKANVAIGCVLTFANGHERADVTRIT